MTRKEAAEMILKRLCPDRPFSDSDEGFLQHVLLLLCHDQVGWVVRIAEGLMPDSDLRSLLSQVYFDPDSHPKLVHPGGGGTEQPLAKRRPWEE